MRRLLLLVALLTVGAVGSANAVPVLVPADLRLYLRNDGSGCPGDRYLATIAGSGEPGCGYVGGGPFGELHHAGVWSSTIKGYTTRDVDAQILDATRDITGTNRVVATATTNRMAAGQVRVDVTVVGLGSDGTAVMLGTDSMTTTVNPTNSAAVDFPFTIDVADELDEIVLAEIRIDVDVRGWHVLTGYHRLNGESHFDLPIYIEEEEAP